MKIQTRLVQRPLVALSALAILIGAAAPMVQTTLVSAADQVTDRSMQMSDSAPSGGSITSGVGSGTAVKYILKFTTASAVQSIVIDFCGDTPLIGDTACTAPGNYVEYGGIALSTTRPITITAKVMETLSFCTSAANLTALGCAGATPPAISIGTGVNNDVIDYTAIYKRSAYSQVSTNASNGYAVYMRAHNTCGGGLSKDNGTTCGIPAINAGAASASLMAAGTAGFGVDVADGSAVVGGTGSNTAGGTATRWNPGTADNYIMDEVTATDNVKYTYGSKIIESAGQANSVTNAYEFAATASPVTPAGIYTQAFSLIAVGVF